MSIQLIRQYHTRVAKIIQYSGTHNESALRKPFQDLLEQYARAWVYRLGNHSALEWVLDRYKETTPRDPTIRDKFNTYRFVYVHDGGTVPPLIDAGFSFVCCLLA